MVKKVVTWSPKLYFTCPFKLYEEIFSRKHNFIWREKISAFRQKFFRKGCQSCVPRVHMNISRINSSLIKKRNSSSFPDIELEFFWLCCRKIFCVFLKTPLCMSMEIFERKNKLLSLRKVFFIPFGYSAKNFRFYRNKFSGVVKTGLYLSI